MTESGKTSLGLPDPDTLHPRMLAHLGDGVYELFVRELALQNDVLQKAQKTQELHQYTTRRVSAAFQVQVLEHLMPQLTDVEAEWVRRGRNMPVSAGRRSDHALHRQATGFEALVGYLYLSDRQRLEALWQEIKPWVQAGELAEQK